MDVPGGDGGASEEERETVEEGGSGDGGEAGEAGGQREEDDPDKSDEITQRILNIMANFLEGEVVLILVLIMCSEHHSVIFLLIIHLCVYRAHCSVRWLARG